MGTMKRSAGSSPNPVAAIAPTRRLRGAPPPPRRPCRVPNSGQMWSVVAASLNSKSQEERGIGVDVNPENSRFHYLPPGQLAFHGKLVMLSMVRLPPVLVNRFLKKLASPLVPAKTVVYGTVIFLLGKLSPPLHSPSWLSPTLRGVGTNLCFGSPIIYRSLICVFLLWPGIFFLRLIPLHSLMRGPSLPPYLWSASKFLYPHANFCESARSFAPHTQVVFFCHPSPPLV